MVTALLETTLQGKPEVKVVPGLHNKSIMCGTQHTVVLGDIHTGLTEVRMYHDGKDKYLLIITLFPYTSPRSTLSNVKLSEKNLLSDVPAGHHVEYLLVEQLVKRRGLSWL